MPFFLDVILGFFGYAVRVLVRTVKFLRGSNWPASTATVMSAVTEGRNGQIYYQYLVDGQNYAGADAKPFLWPGSAELYVHRFRRGDQLKIRIKPRDPSVSVLDA